MVNVNCLQVCSCNKRFKITVARRVARWGQKAPSFHQICNRLQDIFVKEFVQFGPNTPYGLEFTKISLKNKFSCINIIYFFTCTSISFEHIMLWDFYRPPIKVACGMSDVFVPLRTALPAFFGGMCLVLK